MRIYRPRTLLIVFHHPIEVQPPVLSLFPSFPVLATSTCNFFCQATTLLSILAFRTGFPLAYLMRRTFSFFFPVPLLQASLLIPEYESLLHAPIKSQVFPRKSSFFPPFCHFSGKSENFLPPAGYGIVSRAGRESAVLAVTVFCDRRCPMKNWWDPFSAVLFAV